MTLNTRRNYEKNIALPKETNWQVFLQLFADNVPVLISYVDRQRKYRFNNKLYEEWFGYSREEAYGKHVKEIRGIEAYKNLKPYLDQAMSGIPTFYDNILYKNSGEKLYVNVRFIPHRDENNKVLGVFVLVVDITKRKKVELKLQESEERLRKLVDSNIIGVSLADLDGNFYEVNDIFLNMLGYTRKEFKEEKIDWKNITPTEYLHVNKHAEKEVMEKGSTLPYEKAYLRKDGSLVHVLIGNVLIDKEKRKVIALVLDISKQKEIQQRKDEFIALASHELKTPLTSLKLFAQMMGLRIKKNQDKHTSVLFIKMEKQINKLNRLVNSLLDVSRIHAGKLSYEKTIFSLPRLVNETVNELQTIYDKHTFLIQSNVDTYVRADRERIKQVITNLLTNAVKYSSKNNSIILSIFKTGKEIKIGVQDFGVGIPRDLQKSIFDRYFQIETGTKKSTSGMGLGLYLSKEIIERHKGKIWVESEPGKGSIFFFTLSTTTKK